MSFRSPRKLVASFVSLALFALLVFSRFGPSPTFAEQVQETALAVFVPSMSATKTDALTSDPDTDGKADPGDVIRYTVNVANSGADPATGVAFTDTIDPNTTLNGLVAVSGVAVNDTFPVTVLGNVSIDSTAITGGPFSVTANDFRGANPTAAISSYDATTANGGQIVLNLATGTFTYNPPAGFEGTDTFTYALSDNPNAASAASNRTATVSILVSGMIWFVDRGAAPCTTANSDCGRLSNPYSTLEAFRDENGDADVPASDLFYPAAGEAIFIYQNATSYTGGVTLLNNQKLIGQDANASLLTITGLAPPVGSPGFPGMNNDSTKSTITNAAGNGITLATGTQVRGLNVSNTSGHGIAGTSITTAVIGAGTAPSGLDVTVTNSGAGFAAVNFTGAAGGNLDINAQISNNAGEAVHVENRNSGVVNFAGAITSTGKGVFLNSNTGSVLTFAGGLSLNTNTNAGFTAIGGGTVAVTQTGAIFNTISTTSGIALNVTSTNFSPSGLTFRSISSSGSASNGIILNGTGPNGFFTVTGTGSAASGGIIQNTAGADAVDATVGIGIFLQNTRNISLDRMQLAGHANWAIRGNSVHNFTLNNSTINGTNGTEDATDEGSIRFTQLTGSAGITNSNISGGYEDNVAVINTSGVLDRLLVDNVTIGANSTADGSDGLFLQADGTATLKATIEDSFFTSARGDLFQLSIRTGNANDLVFQRNALSNNHANIVSGGGGFSVTSSSASASTLTYNISNNTLRNSVGSALIVGMDGTSGAFSGTISNNVIGIAGATKAGSAQGGGIVVGGFLQGTSTHDLAITNNLVYDYTNNGIYVAAGEATTLSSPTGRINATITGNTVAEPTGFGGFVFNGIRLVLGTSAQAGNPHAYEACVVIGGAGALKNIVTGSSGDPTIPEIRLFPRFASKVAVPGFTPTGSTVADGAAMAAFLAPLNTATAGAINAANSSTNPYLGNCNSLFASPDDGGESLSKGTGGFDLKAADEEQPIISRPMDDDETRLPVNDSDTLAPASLAGVASVASDIEVSEPVQVESTPWAAGQFWSLPGRLVQNISPTVGAEASPDRLLPSAPMSGETVSVTGPVELPTGKGFTIGFSVTVDSLDAGEIRARISNRGSVSWTGIGGAGNTSTQDAAPNPDPACVGVLAGATCTPVDRPDTTVASVTRVGLTRTNAASVQWTVTFANGIAGLASANLSLTESAGTCTGESINTVSGVGAGPAYNQWTVTVNTGTGECTLRLNVVNDAGISYDLTNDPFTAGDTILVDKTAPSTTSFVRFTPLTSPTDADTLVFRVTFSEAVTAVDAADFTVTGTTATVSNVAPVGAGPTYTQYDITVSGGDLASLNAAVGLDFNATAPANFITDTATNNLSKTEPGTDQTYVVDNAVPNVDITDVTPDPRNTSVSTMTIVFSEQVTGFDIGDLSLTRGGNPVLLSGATVTGGPTIYTLNNLTALTGTGGTYVLTLTAPGGIVDGASKALPAGATDTWVMDATPPAVTINQAAGQPDPTATSPLNFTVVFSEAVTGFTNTDISFTGSTAAGTLAAVVSETAPMNRTTYNVAVSGMAGDGTVVAGVVVGAAQDAATNTSAASTSADNSVTFVIPPGVGGFKGDVAPRPNGDGVVQSNDVVQVQRFQIGLDPITPGSNEFRRADSAPLATGGDGSIQSNDVVQTQRFQIGLDPAQNASAPQSDGTASWVDSVDLISDLEGIGRILKVQNASGEAGSQVAVNILVDAAGDEAAYGFTLNYDSTKLSAVSSQTGRSGGSGLCNTGTAGNVSCSVHSFTDDQPGSSSDQIGEIPAGTDQILLRVTFDILPGVSPGTTPLTLTNVNASDDLGSPDVTGQIAGGSHLRILGPTAKVVTVTGRIMTSDGAGLRGATVTIFDSDAGRRSATTSALGYYQFEGVEAGKTYIVSVTSKRFRFNPQTVNVTAALSNVDFVGSQ